MFSVFDTFLIIWTLHVKSFSTETRTRRLLQSLVWAWYDHSMTINIHHIIDSITADDLPENKAPTVQDVPTEVAQIARDGDMDDAVSYWDAILSDQSYDDIYNAAVKKMGDNGIAKEDVSNDQFESLLDAYLDHEILPYNDEALAALITSAIK